MGRESGVVIDIYLYISGQLVGVGRLSVDVGVLELLSFIFPFEV